MTEPLPAVLAGGEASWQRHGVAAGEGRGAGVDGVREPVCSPVSYFLDRYDCSRVDGAGLMMAAQIGCAPT